MENLAVAEFVAQQLTGFYVRACETNGVTTDPARLHEIRRDLDLPEIAEQHQTDEPEPETPAAAAPSALDRIGAGLRARQAAEGIIPVAPLAPAESLIARGVAQRQQASREKRRRDNEEASRLLAEQ